ncbi:hypothetical protein EPUL_002814 [Erysiphe pulchra]|uniref:Uncharacterized protein n=1 Tax=Erysiphe pulchra TaxID=225359 RepID=A0A2S4PRR7_9PEZI|nr:hypothetical protein EPUL_002814 [Erysiphe pulchra]
MDANSAAESIYFTGASGSEFHSIGSGKFALGYKSNGGNSVIGQNEGNSDDPEAVCSQCKHKHENKNCFKQHPKLCKQNNKKNAKEKAKFSAAQDPEEPDSDESFSINAVAKASITRTKNRLLYNKGASYHLVNCKSDFLTLKKLTKPFGLDQVMRKSELLYQGIYRLLVGNLTLDLINTKRRTRNVAAGSNEILVSWRNGSPRKPVAELKSVEGVLVNQPCSSIQDIELPHTVAPGLARIPHTSSQKLLEEIMRNAIDLEGIDLSELATYETCHLSKAQRNISIESRPTTNESLDEIFVDTVSKIIATLNGVQFAVKLTDAKSRMR